MNAGKSKGMVFKRREPEMADFLTPYRVNVPALGRCKALSEGERMEDIKELKYLGTLLCKHE